MAGIYSQGGSAGHRYAGWLSEVEAKNFQFGGKVFNGSPSAIYVGSNQVWPWLTIAAQQAISGAFGQRDGWAVINATNAYLNQLAASGQAGKDKATALAGFINEDPMMVCSLGLEVEGVTMPIRWLVGDGNSWVLINDFTIDKDKWLTKFRYKLGNIVGCPIGSRNLNNSMRGFNTLYISGRFDSKGESTGYSASGTIGILIDEDYTLVELTNTKVRQYRNSIGTYTDYAKNATGQTQNYSLSPCLCVFGVHTRDGSVDTVSQVGNMKVSVAEFRDAATDGNKLLEIIPFKSATREGMVDLVNATFHPNQGTGHFTDAYTLQDGVTPWTPSTS